MSNISTYIRFRADIPLFRLPFNDLDAAVLANLVALDFTELFDQEITVGELAKRYKEAGKKCIQDDYGKDKEELLYAVGESVRFKNLKVSRYVCDIDPEQEKTFYAITYRISPFLKMVAYRGTDGSLISWKENFNALYTLPTPGQSSAVEYLNGVGKNPFVKCIVAGHSKGGNLAVYASLFCDSKLQKRISRVYSFDGPGFIVDIRNLAQYETLKDRIVSYVPAGCVVGNLLNPPYENRIVVAAAGKGIFQHDMFKWKVNSAGFIPAVKEEKDGVELSKQINEWIDTMPLSERSDVVNELFGSFMNNGILHVNDVVHGDGKHIMGLVKSLTKLSQKNRHLLWIILKEVRSKK